MHGNIIVARLRRLVAMAVSKNRLLRRGCEHLSSALLVVLGHLSQIKGVGVFA